MNVVVFKMNTYEQIRNKRTCAHAPQTTKSTTQPFQFGATPLAPVFNFSGGAAVEVMLMLLKNLPVIFYNEMTDYCTHIHLLPSCVTMHFKSTYIHILIT